MTARYYKGREVLKEYKQGRLVYEKSIAIPDYLCFTALEAGTFTLTIPAAVTPTYLSYVEWSKNGRTWNHTDNTSEAVTIDVQVASGDKVYWRGSGASTASGVTVATMSSKFSSDCRFDASGNALSLLLADNFDGVTSLPSGRYTFVGLFHGCSTIVNAEHLLLPATTLRQDCYRSMFLNCTSLVTPPNLPSTTLAPSCYLLMFGYCRSMTTAPALPATVLASQCYYQMFYDCKALTTAPALPATSMVYYCYYRMFEGCTGLTSAPELLAKNTFTSCYQRMFYNCTNLTYVKCMAEDLSSTNCVADWLQGVSSTGTFIQAEGVEWPRGASGIPTGWVDVEKRTMPSGYKQVEYVANPNKPSTTPAPIIETGIVLDPSQDTIEIAVFPTFDEDGYIAHYQYGGVLLGNSSSPGQSTAKVGRFYWMYRKNSTTNMIQLAWTRATATTGSLSVTNKIVETPQTLRIELLGGNGNRLLLNGTQVAYNTSDCDVSDMGTETAKLYGYNNTYYNWIDPIYYMKWWRNGVLIADYVACVRESDNEPSFYDFVSNTFKVPTRTGFFIAGEEI